MALVKDVNTNNEIITKINSMARNTPLDLIYFNLVFTNNEIILDFLNRSFRTWILRIKPYKVLNYEGINISKIRNRHKENIVIKYEDINEIKLSNRTFIKNAYIEISAKGLENKLRLFTREKLDFENDYNILKEVLSDKIIFNSKGGLKYEGTWN